MTPSAQGLESPENPRRFKGLYDEILGGIGPYLGGALFLTQLYAQGYTLQSLRRDLVDDPAVLAKVNELYQAYLKREIHPSDYANVKSFLIAGGTLRAIELQIVQSPECQP